MTDLPIYRVLLLISFGGALVLLVSDAHHFFCCLRNGEDFPETASVAFRKHLMLLSVAGGQIAPNRAVQNIAVCVLINAILWHFVGYCRRKIEKSRRSPLVERIPSR